MLEEMGLLPELEAQGLRAPVYQYRNRMTGEVLRLDLTEIADLARHPYRLQCEQFKLTRLISGRLADHPCGRALFQRRLLYFQEDGGGVTVTVETPYEVETYRADYLIGADGANSLIRKLLGVCFSGFTYPEKFLTLSTKWPLEQSFPGLEKVAYMAGGDNWRVLLRVPEYWRVLAPAAETMSDDRLLSEEMKTAVFDDLGVPGAQVTTHHRTLYRVHQRVAETFRRGRVILIGDAAHLNNPLGGFGMNAGVHDAWNLTGRLKDILQNGADPDAELDCYDRQRRGVMTAFVQAQTIRNKADLEAGDAEAQRRSQARLQETIDNPELRRDYMLNQAMIKSLELEASIP